ncbi:MAG: peptidyl-prolyl cis-trans isomerase [Myxococcota bacterium]
MLRVGIAVLLSTAGALAVAQQAEEDPQAAANEARRARVYAQVGDAAVTVGDIEDAINKQSPFLRGRYREPGKLRELADSLIRFELLAREAARQNYDENPIVSRSVKQNLVQQLIRTQFDERITRESITDEEILAYYTEHDDEFSRPEMVRASHILVDGEDTARELLGQVQEADARTFRQLARQHSIDTETKLRGGDLRYFTQDGRPSGAREDDPPVDEAIVQAAFALEDVGDVAAAPVAVGEHWSLVKLTGRRPAETRTIEQTREGIRLRLWREKRQSGIEEFVRELRTSHPPDIHVERMRPIRLEAVAPAARLPGKGPHGGIHGRQLQQQAEAENAENPENTATE